MRKFAPLVSALLLFFITSVVAAQSSPAIDRGVVNFTGSAIDPVANFAFQGPGMMTLTGYLIDGVHSPSCVPCTGGQQIHIYSSYGGELSIRPGYLTTGVESRFVYYAGTLMFDSAPVTLPIQYGRAPFRVIVPVTLQGNLQVHGTNPFSNSNNLLFQMPLNLQGKAILTLRTQYIDFQGRPVYQFRGLTYDFPLAGQTDEQ